MLLLLLFFQMLIIFTELLVCAQIWIAAMSFQKYHGGIIINAVKQLFQQLSHNPKQRLYSDKNLPDTAYFSVDKADAGNFEAEALNALTTSISAFVNNLFAREELSSLTFNKENPPDDNYKFNKEDLENLINAMKFLSKRSDVIAPEVEFYKKAP